ncbi:hypothetical protein SAMN04488543_3170 [Friedmanniella luteola]|uniref:Uncharacterized protein n=1 Tax=Friedmanniella luteola TaxID=546871 RepID=A0A1H1Y2D8_9ACTN|nr:DUF5701 family protein [Friedmanniella luteola]SDT15590.1 hypothetical protein SAMN04488543_3170 [Friedmanniella luteola]
MPHATLGAPAGTDLDAELDRQRQLLLDSGAADDARLDADALAAALDRLRPALRALHLPAATTSAVPFVLVPSSGDLAHDLAAAERQVLDLRLAGRSDVGVLDRNHGEEGLARYRPIAEVGPPPARLCALVGVERGEEFCGVRPEEALPVLLGRGRTPLTIGDGIALVRAFPAVLEKNRCFMLSGSRRGDRRVPALWISGRSPKLGWCWDGNPHSWLGVASAAARLPGRRADQPPGTA